MLLPDVNILVAAYVGDDGPKMARREWLQELVGSREPFGMSELVLAAFLRIATNERIFPGPTEGAYALVASVTRARGCVRLRPGPAHWGIFTSLCRQTGLRGPVLSDIYHAALAIEHDCEWVSDDHDFVRIPGLRWRRPVEDE